jgi:hypothetical protein
MHLIPETETDQCLLKTVNQINVHSLKTVNQINVHSLKTVNQINRPVSRIPVGGVKNVFVAGLPDCLFSNQKSKFG